MAKRHVDRPATTVVTASDSPAACEMSDSVQAALNKLEGVVLTPPSQPQPGSISDVTEVISCIDGDHAVTIAAGHDGVHALVLIDSQLSERSIELIGSAANLAVLTCIDPRLRTPLASAVDGHLASTHEDSEIWIEPRNGQVPNDRILDWLSRQRQLRSQRQNVTIATPDGWRLVADLSLPLRDDPGPAIVLFHSGRSDRAVFRRLARLLARRGFVVCSLDWRGRGASTNLGHFVDFTGSEATSPSKDVAAAYGYLDALDEVNGRFGVLGIAHGAGFAFTGGLADTRTEAVVFMTGLHTATEYQRARMASGDVEFLFVSATPHELTTNTMRALYAETQGNSTRFLQYPEGVLGYQFFDVHPDLEPTIVDWFAEVLEP